MSNGSQGGFEFPTRQWITWGLVAIGALVGLIVVINLIGSDVEPIPDTPVGVEQMEWSIVLTDFTGAEVTLKGDEPLGFPTETWEDDSLLEREVQATFGWDTDLKVPSAVVTIDISPDCDSLNNELIAWGTQIGTAAGEARKRQAQAFTQYAINTMRDRACDVDLTSLDF